MAKLLQFDHSITRRKLANEIALIIQAYENHQATLSGYRLETRVEEIGKQLVRLNLGWTDFGVSLELVSAIVVAGWIDKISLTIRVYNGLDHAQKQLRLVDFQQNLASQLAGARQAGVRQDDLRLLVNALRRSDLWREAIKILGIPAG